MAYDELLGVESEAEVTDDWQREMEDQVKSKIPTDATAVELSTADLSMAESTNETRAKDDEHTKGEGEKETKERKSSYWLSKILFLILRFCEPGLKAILGLAL